MLNHHPLPVDLTDSSSGSRQAPAVDRVRDRPKPSGRTPSGRLRRRPANRGKTPEPPQGGQRLRRTHNTLRESAGGVLFRGDHRKVEPVETGKCALPLDNMSRRTESARAPKWQSQRPDGGLTASHLLTRVGGRPERPRPLSGLLEPLRPGGAAAAELPNWGSAPAPGLGAPTP